MKASQAASSAQNARLPAGARFKALVQTTQRTVERFRLIGQEEQVAVAFSGGKDSLTLCAILKELEISFVPIVVDMGYETGWGDRVARLLKPLGVSPLVLLARDHHDSEDRRTLNIIGRLKILDAQNGREDVTPCTHCYSVKVLLMHGATRRLGIRRVAFGQHHTDALASLLKEGLMHIDRCDGGHARFSRSTFHDLALRLQSEARSYKPEQPSSIVRRIEELIFRNRLDTDEPPRQDLIRGDPSIELIRPMFDCDERMIIRFQQDWKLTTEGSGCSHSLSSMSHTPREVVHYQVLRGILNKHFDAWGRWAVNVGIDDNGTNKVGARYRRAEFLGRTYKQTGAGVDKL